MGKLHYVYWYHLKEHTDKFTQGYVGVTVNLHIRHNIHKQEHPQRNSIINKAFKKYGEDQLIRTVLFTGTKKAAYSLEKALRPKEKIGWNIAIGGGYPPDCTGRHHSQETKEKISKGNLGKKGKPSKFKGIAGRYTDEQKAAIGAKSKGRKHTEATKEKIRKAALGSKSTLAKQIHLVHINDLENVLTFGSISDAARELNLNYSRVRSLHQTVLKTGKTAGKVWICLSSEHITNPKKAIKETQTFYKTKQKAYKGLHGKDNYKSQVIIIENKEEVIIEYPSISQAAKAIGMSDATLRFHVAQTKKNKKDANYTRSGWRVKYRKVQE